MISPLEVAEALGVSRNTVLRWISEGTLPAVKLGSARNASLRVDPEDVARMIQEARPA